MFSSKQTNRNLNKTDTLIGEGSTFEGKIKSEASIRIEGKIIGDIEAGGDVVIGESGAAWSNIAARDLILAGQLTGSITIRGKLTICATGSLNGNIAAQSFIIEAGGRFNGSSSMTDSKSDAENDKKAMKSSSLEQ